jgi:hypothetical protein
LKIGVYVRGVLHFPHVEARFLVRLVCKVSAEGMMVDVIQVWHLKFFGNAFS